MNSLLMENTAICYVVSTRKLEYVINDISMITRQGVTYSGAQLVDNVRNIELGMEIDVPWSICLARAHPAGKHAELASKHAYFIVVKDFSDQILAQIWHVCNTSFEWVKHECMGVRIDLSLGNGGCVIIRVIHPTVLLRSCDHFLPSFGVVDILDGTSELARFLRQWDYNKSRVPVVNSNKMALLTIDGQVAGGGPACIDATYLSQASVRMNFIGEYLAVFFNVFSACVDHIQPMKHGENTNRVRRYDKPENVSCYIGSQRYLLTWDGSEKTRG